VNVDRLYTEFKGAEPGFDVADLFGQMAALVRFGERRERDTRSFTLPPSLAPSAS
jgi:hypothetical protein